MEIKIQKILSDYGICSRRAGEELIQQGNVTVNGSIAMIGQRADPEKDIICVDGKTLSSKPEDTYILLNKPKGYVVTLNDEKGRRNVTDLLQELSVRVYPVGRLDIDTEGFLLLTNDGELAHNMLSPNKNVGKTYFLSLEKPITDEEIKALETGVDIGECVTKPAKAERISENEINLTITEGKFHQIKRMAKAVGNEVVYLKRLSYGSFYLDKALRTGDYRALTEKETKYLCNVYKRKSLNL